MKCSTSGHSRWGLVGALAAATCAGCGSGNSPNELGAIVDKVVAQEMKEQGLPSMVVTISKRGTPLYVHAYGYADIKTHRLSEPDTEYQIGSVTKQFTAAAILQLQSTGKVDLDQPVAGYLPGYAFDAQITVRMLLNQTSGLADYVDFPLPPGWQQGLAENNVLQAIAAAPLGFSPGSAYQYSNSNYYLLGAVIEAVTGESYTQYVNVHILEPAGLTHTGFSEPLSAAQPYMYPSETTPRVTTELTDGVIPDASVFFAAGALWSTVGDLTKWNAALLDGRIIPQSQLTLMVTPPTSVPDFQQPTVPPSYAMGWVRDQVGTHPFLWHNGQTLAYTAFNGMFLDDGFSISIVTNVPVQEDTPLLHTAQELIQTICTSAGTADRC